MYIKKTNNKTHTKYTNEEKFINYFEKQGFEVIDITNDIVPGEYPNFSLKFYK